MKGSPGNSLFQNSHFERLQTDSVAPEELEAQEDEIRLQRELKDELEREFDDFDNGSADGSSYSASISGCYNNSSSVDRGSKNQKLSNGSPAHVTNISNENRRYRSKDYSNLEQLEVLYSVREREIEQLRDEIDNLKKKSDTEKFELTCALQQAQLEAQKVATSRNEIQTILVETTSRLTEAEKELSNLKQKCSDSELIKSNALHELEMCKITIRELEQRLMVAEKNSYKSEEANFDHVLKELTSNHKQEISNLEKKIGYVNNKLKAKEKDCTKLEQQLVDLQHAHQTMLTEKSEIIDKLNSNLVKCRTQYQKSIESSKSYDVSKLEAQLEQQIVQNDALRRDITELNVKLEQRITQNETLRQELISLNELIESKKNWDNTNIAARLEQQINQNEILKREISTLKRENESLIAQQMQITQEQEALKIGLMDYVTKTDILHQEQLSELQLACSKQILHLESQLKECENNIKDRVFKVYAEEVERTTTEFMKHFDTLNQTVERLKMELLNKTKQLKHANDAVAEHVSRTDIVYSKYVNARKKALALKEFVDDREELMKRHRKQYLLTLNRAQKYLDDAMVSNTFDNLGKLSQLIEKSTKNINMDELWDQDVEELAQVGCKVGKADAKSKDCRFST